jgi:hypothetical protein
MIFLLLAMHKIKIRSGGAHGNLFIRTLNFERSTEGLEIGSLFTPGSNYLTKLSELSRPKLKADLKENLGNWSDDGTSPITKNFEAFYLTPGKLHIIFPASFSPTSPRIKVILLQGLYYVIKLGK